MASSVRDLLRLPTGTFDLESIDASATPGAPGDKQETLAEFEQRAEELFELGERLMADGSHSGRRVLLVLQGMDGCGKGGTVKHVVGQIDPLLVRVWAFKKPTEEELSHHFLWRIRKRLPEAGQIGVFDRSHYEDVIAVRVRELIAQDEWEPRFKEINEFEAELAADGVAIVKCFLHISYDEQAKRQLERLDDPTKRWKFNPGDLDDRDRWGSYMEAYVDALSRCDHDVAPWYVVPADRKWYRKWAVQSLLLETLREMDPQYPQRPDLDDEALRERLLATMPS